MERRMFFVMMVLFSLFSIPASAAQTPQVVLETSMGDITLELYPDKAPATVKNFLSYVDEKFYDGLVFHRVIRGFMIQGGGMDAQMKEKATHAPILNEADNGLKNDRGTIAMARTPDPNSATAQFFINAKDNTFLNFRSKTMDGYGYCVFGKVIKGMDVVDAIEAVATGNKGFHQDVPVKPVLIKKAYRVKEKKGASS
jgi:peptidyl-prolyl cis-trans isomerase B (cyclophilin B)